MISQTPISLFRGLGEQAVERVDAYGGGAFDYGVGQGVAFNEEYLELLLLSLGAVTEL